MLDDLEREIAQILDDIAKKDRQEGGLSNSVWTKLVKEGLCALGKSHNYKVSATGCREAKTSEWMFDLMWAEGSDEEFLEMPFAMECEWCLDFDEMFWDFEKLLIAKAPHKLFVFQQRNANEVKNARKKLSAAILSFRNKQSGERYMLAGWSGDTKSFIYYVNIVL